MKKIICFIVFCSILSIGGGILAEQVKNAELERCGYCTEEYPCATQWYFLDQFTITANVFCKINSSGIPHWDIKEKERFDIFYFENSNKSRKNPKVKL